MNINEIFKKFKVIAVVGFSDNPSRPSNRIGKYLMRKNFKVYGVNPNLKGKIIDEVKCYNSIKDVPGKIEIVNVFRRSEFVYDLVKEILELDYRPNVIWTQIGVINKNTREFAQSNGFVYIEDKCIMIEHQNITS